MKLPISLCVPDMQYNRRFFSNKKYQTEFESFKNQYVLWLHSKKNFSNIICNHFKSLFKRFFNLSYICENQQYVLIWYICLNHLHGQNSFDYGHFVTLRSKISVLTMVKTVLTMQMIQALGCQTVQSYSKLKTVFHAHWCIFKNIFGQTLKKILFWNNNFLNDTISCY